MIVFEIIGTALIVLLAMMLLSWFAGLVSNRFRRKSHKAHSNYMANRRDDFPLGDMNLDSSDD